MKKYVKPILDVVELRLEERVAKCDHKKEFNKERACTPQPGGHSAS